MAICIYDNPGLKIREAWHDGEVVYSISHRVIESPKVEIIGHPAVKFIVSAGPWSPGKILFGDVEAMNEGARNV